MRTLLSLLLMAALPGFAANTHLYVNAVGTGLDSGHTCLTTETDDSADTACASLHGTNTAADSALIDFTTDIDGVDRTAPWGIGADEYAASVGRHKRVGAIQ